VTCFCKTCGTTTHYTAWGGKVVQTPLCLTGLKDTVDMVGFSVWASSSVPCSKGDRGLDAAATHVFDGMPNGAALDAFMSVIKG
jgi:hypothetical protein